MHNCLCPPLRFYLKRRLLPQAWAEIYSLPRIFPSLHPANKILSFTVPEIIKRIAVLDKKGVLGTKYLTLHNLSRGQHITIEATRQELAELAEFFRNRTADEFGRAILSLNLDADGLGAVIACLQATAIFANNPQYPCVSDPSAELSASIGNKILELHAFLCEIPASAGPQEPGNLGDQAMLVWGSIGGDCRIIARMII